MEEKIFNNFRDLIYNASGISLGPNKVELLTARVAKRMRLLGIPEHSDYFKVVVDDKSGKELGELLNAISTNVTHFFREEIHFKFLADRIQELNDSDATSFRIWCAASSSGEEPYSIAITVLENLKKNILVEIIASDISTKVLHMAKNGVYRDSDVKTINKDILKKYFQVGTGRAAGFYKVKDNLKKMVQFKQINLSTPPFPIKGDLDLIFCRNVMIYFNDTLKKHLVDNFSSILKPTGYLIVGLSESLTGKSENLKLVNSSIYSRKN